MSNPNALIADLKAVLDKHDVILQVKEVPTGIGFTETFVATDLEGELIVTLNEHSGSLSSKDLRFLR